ncbi:MAG: cohesin domain-containing protein [Gemmatimonadota bacterium]|nr:cohesin domain-containing protein [Gemmatimonadota bacterium]
MMKKSLLISLFGLLLTTAFAFGENTMTVVSVTGDPGADVVVAINVTSDKNIAGTQFDVNFDQTKLQIKEAGNGTDAATMTIVGLTDAITAANTSGKLSASQVDFTFSSPVAAGENKQLFVITFTIAADASGVIPVTLTGVSLSDESAGSITVTAVDGAVTAGGAEPPAANKLWITSCEGEAGADVTVQVMVTSDKNVAGTQFEVNFDHSVLQVAEAKNGADATAMTVVGLTDAVTAANSSGKLSVSQVDFTFSSPVAAGENKQLFDITFTIAAGAAAGTVELTMTGVSLSDESAASITVETENGAVTVSGGTEPPPPPPPPPPAGNKLWVTDATGSAGSSVTVQVLVTSDKNIAGTQFEVNFDHSVLQVAEAKNGADATAMTVVGLTDAITAANTSGKLSVSQVDFTFSSPVAAGENKQLFDITFTIAEGAAAGTAELALTGVSLSDESAGSITVESASGAITIEGGGETPWEPPAAPTDRNVIIHYPIEGTAAGQTCTTHVDMNTDTQISGAQFTVTFDPALIQIASVAKGTGASAFTIVGLGADEIAAANTSGSFMVSMVDFTFSTPIQVGLSSLIDIEFSFVKAGIATFQISDASMSDPSANAVTFETWSYDLPTPVGGEDVPGVALPKAFALSQNAPNPFNPSTTVNYEVAGDGASATHVRINVYNLRGQTVATLVDEFKPAGRYSVQWSGVDNSGRKVSSGIYFYRLQSDKFVQTRKMVILK